MANRGRQTFNKRLKEQQRKEKQQEKFARRLQRKEEKPEGGPDDDIQPLDESFLITPERTMAGRASE